MKIDLQRVADLMNKVCGTNLDVEEYKGKLLVDEKGQLEIQDENETNETIDLDHIDCCFPRNVGWIPI